VVDWRKLSLRKCEWEKFQILIMNGLGVDNF